MKKNQILIANQKEELDWTENVPLAAKKSLGGFCPCFMLKIDKKKWNLSITMFLTLDQMHL